MAAKSAPQASAARLRFDFHTAYFAVVSTVSILVFVFSLISLLANAILLAWPELLEADMMRAAARAEQFPDDEASRPPPFMFLPSNRELVQDALSVVVMGVVFWFHGRYFFAQKRS